MHGCPCAGMRAEVNHTVNCSYMQRFVCWLNNTKDLSECSEFCFDADKQNGRIHFNDIMPNGAHMYRAVHKSSHRFLIDSDLVFVIRHTQQREKIAKSLRNYSIWLGPCIRLAIATDSLPNGFRLIILRLNREEKVIAKIFERQPHSVEWMLCCYLDCTFFYISADSLHASIPKWLSLKPRSNPHIWYQMTKCKW